MYGELVHYGVKGMRWGVRRASAQSVGGTSGSKRTQKIRSKLETLNGDLGAAALEKKLAKSKYRDQYMAGKNGVSKMLARLTDMDVTYADVMYDLNEGRAVNAQKRDITKKIRNGRSFVSNLYGSLTDADRIESDILYDFERSKK